MFEPLAIRDHVGLAGHPEYNGKQAVVMCNPHFNYGLSVVWARPDTNIYTGLYCNNVDTYEVALVQWQYEGEIKPWEFTLLPDGLDIIGHVTIEDVGELVEAIMVEGLEGYTNFKPARLRGVAV